MIFPYNVIGIINMAFTKINFKNLHTDAVCSAPVGFSWTVLFFGFFVPLIRGNWKWFAIMLLCGLVTWGLSNLVFCFIFNKMHIKDLIGQGFKATAVDSGNWGEVASNIGTELPRVEATA